MSRRTRKLILLCLLCISFFPVSILAQTTFPTENGDRMNYHALIEMPKAYISGICVLLKEDDNNIKGILFNEFGITALEFSYCQDRQKVKLQYVIDMLDKWYIRRLLRKDLVQVMRQLQNGIVKYHNKRRHINYQFIPMTDETEK